MLEWTQVATQAALSGQDGQTSEDRLPEVTDGGTKTYGQILELDRLLKLWNAGKLTQDAETVVYLALAKAATAFAEELAKHE